MVTTRPDLEQISRVFQALSDETRLRIVRRLARSEQCVCDLQGTVGAYQSRLSFHLRKLKDAGIVSDRKVGRWVYYSLNADVLEAAAGFLTATGAGELAVLDEEGCAC